MRNLPKITEIVAGGARIQAQRGCTLVTTEEKPPCLNSWAPCSYSDSAHDPEDQPGLQIANEVGGSQTTLRCACGYLDSWASEVLELEPRIYSFNRRLR